MKLKDTDVFVGFDVTRDDWAWEGAAVFLRRGMWGSLNTVYGPRFTALSKGTALERAQEWWAKEKSGKNVPEPEEFFRG